MFMWVVVMLKVVSVKGGQLLPLFGPLARCKGAVILQKGWVMGYGSGSCWQVGQLSRRYYMIVNYTYQLLTA